MLSKKCRKCGEKLSIHHCRCYRCRSCDVMAMALYTGLFVVGNVFLGIVLTKMFSEM